MLGLCVVIVIGGFIWLAIPPKEPAYKGESLSYWLSRAVDGPKGPKDSECTNAVRHIGSNAIPVLLQILRAKDSSFKIKLMDLAARQNFVRVPISSVEEQKQKAAAGFEFLGDLATNALPGLIDISGHPPSPYSKEIADRTLMELYPAPCVAVPYWVAPTNKVGWYLMTGSLKSESGSPSNAMLAFSRAIELAPTNTEAYFGCGASKMQLKDYPGAITDMERVIELSPTNERAFYARGLCKMALKDLRSAEADLTTAINLETNDADAYSYRGVVRADMHELNDALTDLNKAIELSPWNAAHYRNRGAVEGLQREYELALVDITKSIEMDKSDGSAYTVRGRIKCALRDYKAAQADFNKAIALDPKDSSAYVFRGADWVYMDDYDRAAADLEKALELDPKTAGAFTVRGMLKAKRGGEDDGALADFERAIELAPQWPETYGMLGLFQYKIAHWEPALANCRKALKLGAGTNGGDYNCYIWLIRAQSGEEAGANDELNVCLKSLPAAKTNEWGAITVRFFAGSLPESNFLSLATTSAKRPSAVSRQVCESLYYAGMKHKLAGDKKGAEELFQKCLNTKDENTWAYMNAGVEMRGMKE